MSIRIVDGCGTLPTSLKDGNLLIYGYNKKIVATIPLPFKTKFNGPYVTEFIMFPNVMVLTTTDQGDVLVMRFDGSYTLYTEDLRVKGFGTFDMNLFKSQIYADVFGSYEEIPEGKKKPRLYEAYIVRFRESDVILYTCAYHRWIKNVCNLNDPRVYDIFVKGLNLGITGYPKLTPMQDCLQSEEGYVVPCDDIDLTVPDIQGRLRYTTEEGYTGFNILARRCPYGEVVRSLCQKFDPPDYVKEMIDVHYLGQPDRSFSGLPKSTLLYQMACVMNLHPEYIMACEISSFVFYTVDDEGTVRNHTLYDYTAETVDYEGQLQTRVPCAKSKYNMCGFINNRAMEISTPTILPRLPHFEGKVYVGDKEIVVPSGVTAAQRPDPMMKGYVECVAQGASCVLYTDTYDTVLL